MKKLLYFISPVALLLASCSSDEPNPGTKEPIIDPVVENVTLELNSAETAAAAQMQGFNMNFFKAMCAAEKNGNIVASPLSAQLLLSMVSNGSSEQTTAEIAAALGCNDLEAVNSLAGKYLVYLPAADKAVKLDFANSVWYHNSFSLASDFTGTMNAKYQADVFKRDLQSNSKAVVDEINGWVNNKTQGLIPKIIEMLPRETISILANALYYNGQWADPFDAKETAKGEFHGAKGTKTIDMMHKSGMQHYYEGDGFRAVKMEAGANEVFEAVMVLPDEGVTVDELLSGGKLDDVASLRFVDTAVDYYLPKFKIEPTERNISGTLAAMGMPSLSKMQKLTMFNEKVDACFKVFQTACIEFTEKGAEGAAVTWTGLEMSPGPGYKTPEVKFDRPFAFFINETKTGACLFAARVNQL